jgi:hypothetical protein
MKLFVETHVRSQDRQKGAQQFVDNRAQHFVVCLFDHFISSVIIFIELNMMIFFQETYNSRLRERYGDDPSTHLNFDPDLWMEVGSSSGPDPTANNLRAACSVSTVGSSQSVLSTQSKEFVALQQHTTQLTEKYEQLSANYEQLRQMVMNMASQSGDTCAPLFWLYNNQPPPPAPPLC